MAGPRGARGGLVDVRTACSDEIRASQACPCLPAASRPDDVVASSSELLPQCGPTLPAPFQGGRSRGVRSPALSVGPVPARRSIPLCPLTMACRRSPAWAGRNSHRVGWGTAERTSPTPGGKPWSAGLALLEALIRTGPQAAGTVSRSEKPSRWSGARREGPHHLRASRGAAEQTARRRGSRDHEARVAPDRPAWSRATGCHHR